MKVEAHKTESINIEVESFSKFTERYPVSECWIIDAIDDVEVIAMCEVCGEPITEEQEYLCDSEGVFWHKGGCKKPILRVTVSITLKAGLLWYTIECWHSTTDSWYFCAHFLFSDTLIDVWEDSPLVEVIDKTKGTPGGWRKAMGCAPDYTGGVPAEEAIRKLRDTANIYPEIGESNG